MAVPAGSTVSTQIPQMVKPVNPPRKRKKRK